MRSAYGKHALMYSNFRLVGIHIWNYILDNLDVNGTLPKKTLKTLILADNFTYHIVESYLSIRHLFLHHLLLISITFLFDIVYYLLLVCIIFASLICQSIFASLNIFHNVILPNIKIYIVKLLSLPVTQHM